MEKDEIEITHEMIKAGVMVLVNAERPNSDYEQSADVLLVRDIFEAMIRRGALRTVVKY